MNIYNEELVGDEESRALKELGFEYEPLYIKFTHNIYKHDEYWDIGPTYSQAFRWFRKFHGLISFVCEVHLVNKGLGFCYEINQDLSEHHKTYEEAELTCLRELIEIIK